MALEKSEAIEKLGEGVRKTSRLDIYSIDGTGEVSKILKNALLSIPGHAKYYQDKIEFLRVEVLANARKSDDEIGKMQDEGKNVVHESDYETFGSMIAFPTLSLLPSAESVAVLGSFLNDPVGRDGKTLLGGQRDRPGNDFPPHPCNAEMATAAIRNLGIDHPPFPVPKGRAGESMSDREVDAWKGWWDEVKSGRRTYRFIGSSIQYGPDGPASAEIIQRVERDRKRDDERAAGRTKSSSGPESAPQATGIREPLAVAGLVAACALVGAAAWYFLRGRKAP